MEGYLIPFLLIKKAPEFLKIVAIPKTLFKLLPAAIKGTFSPKN